jgi:hypothetical protein
MMTLCHNHYMAYCHQSPGDVVEKYLREDNPKYVEIDKRLHAVIAELDNDFLQRVTNAEWGTHTEDSHWYDAVLQMMYCIVASYGVRVDEFFADWVCEPHNCYLLREYDRRKELGIYATNTPAKRFDGMNKSFDRGSHYGMHGMTKK